MFMFKLNVICFLVRWKRFLIFVCLTALLCVFAGLLGNYFLYGEKAVDSITIAVADEDNSMESRLFYNIVANMKEYESLIIFEKTDSQKALARLRENRATAAVTIPQGFAENIKNGENQPFSIIYNTATPIKAALIKQFTDAFTRMLTASQIGVYAALDYARATADAEDYAMMFRGINLKYMNIVLNRATMFDVQTVSAAGEAGLFQYYAFAAYTFVTLAGALLFTDILQRNFRRDTLMRLKRLGVGAFNVTAAAVGSVFAVLALIQIIFGGLIVAAEHAAGFDLGMNISLALMANLSLILFATAAFTVFSAACFKTVFSAGIFISVISLVFLILSGGILPVLYFSDLFAFLSRFTLNYWAVQLLTDSLAGRFVPENAAAVCLFILGFASCAALSFWRNAKAGDQL